MKATLGAESVSFRCKRSPTIESTHCLLRLQTYVFFFSPVEKYGTDDKMTISAFELWWKSTYTTYSDDGLSRMVDEIENAPSPLLDTIPELPDVPHNSNIAVSRS